MQAQVYCSITTFYFMLNFFFPILVQDVLYTVCNPIGSVLRIVIFKRNGIQAMVEYPYGECEHVYLYMLCVCATMCGVLSLTVVLQI